MSAFRFLKPALPQRIVLLSGYALIGVIALIGLALMSGADGRKSQMAEMQQVIARAAQVTESTTVGLPDTAFYTGETPQLAQAVLQSNLQALAEANRISIDVMRADQIDQIDGFVRLNLTLTGVAPEPDLGGFLHGLAVLEPIVVISEISLRRARENRRNAQRRVSFQVQLYGLAQR